MTFAIIGNLDKPGLPGAVARVMEVLGRAGVEYVLDERIIPLLGANGVHLEGRRGRPAETCVSEASIVVAFGGDGTILSTARMVGARGTPILGVNLGKLGFLAESSTEDLQRVLTDILEHRYLVEERLVLQATTSALPGSVIHAVNDIVVDKSRSSRLIDVETHIDDAFAVTYRGDGLIISTPTGSTGYALSNSGPIVTPVCRVLGITPIAPHTLNGRPLIIPESSTIRIIVRAPSDEVLLSADGQSELVATPPLEVVIARAAYPLRLVKRLDRTYFDILRAKLFWGQDARSM
jgi:NAD+ kinase